MSGSLEVAAVIPARDGLPDVLEAVASVLAQSRAPAEVIVVDDASSDGTGAEVRRRFGDRVRVLSGTFGSAGAARNAGWRAARAPWIAFLDADDLWFADKLAMAEKLIASRPDAVWFFSDGAFRTLEGDLCPSWLHLCADMPERYVGCPTAELFDVNFVLTSSVMARRDALARLDGFDASLTHAEDLDLWIRLSRLGPAVASRRALVRYQHRPGGLTRQAEARLTGDVTVFERLTADPTLPDALRRRARRREALAHYKLAVAAIREGRSGAARAHLRHACDSARRAPAVVAAWAASLLPRPLLDVVRNGPWPARRMAASMVRMRRVTLRSEEASTGGAGTDEPARPEARA